MVLCVDYVSNDYNCKLCWKDIVFVDSFYFLDKVECLWFGFWS